jgi:hypothetical protein
MSDKWDELLSVNERKKKKKQIKKNGEQGVLLLVIFNGNEKMIFERTKFKYNLIN